MAHHCEGTFEVKMAALAAYNTAADSGLARMSLDKTFHGPLTATGCGDFLSAMGSQAGSAGYVALERVTGTLEGRAGSFALMHRGVMNRGVPELLITVVPDSGTQALTGLSGTLSIRVADGTHHYQFDYEIAEAV